VKKQEDAYVGLEKMLLSRLKMMFKKEIQQTSKEENFSRYIKNEEWLDYPSLWRESSCNGRGELIHYLVRNEKLFREKEHQYCPIVEIDFSKRTAGITDILSVDGVSNSRSPIEQYANLHEFSLSLKENAKSFFPNTDVIEFYTDDDFRKNCKFVKDDQHKLHDIKIQKWNEKKYISIDNCSHHLAAIYRQCKKQGKTYNLYLDIVYENVNSERLCQLLGEYYFIFSANSNLIKINKKYEELYPEKSVVMHAFDSHTRLSHVFPLKKEFEFNKFFMKLLKDYNNQFLILNDELEKLYL